MTEQENKEKDYLLNVYKDKLPSDNPFIILAGPDKEMFVIGGDDELVNNLDLLTQYRSLYDTVLDLDSKISFSLKQAIENAYSDEVINGFDAMSVSSIQEWMSYYFVENALFRIEAMWDILAQIFNLKYSIGLDKAKVYHNRLFSNKVENISRYWNGKLPNEVSKIVDYFNEEDDDSIEDGMWKGNYKFVNSLRNDMTHKISISMNSFSTYAFSLKKHPSYIIKRVSECYSKLEEFICEAVEDIEENCDDFISFE